MPPVLADIDAFAWPIVVLLGMLVVLEAVRTFRR
jgi:hypothetical protein